MVEEEFSRKRVVPCDLWRSRVSVSMLGCIRSETTWSPEQGRTIQMTCPPDLPARPQTAQAATNRRALPAPAPSRFLLDKTCVLRAAAAPPIVDWTGRVRFRPQVPGPQCVKPCEPRREGERAAGD